MTDLPSFHQSEESPFGDFWRTDFGYEDQGFDGAAEFDGGALEIDDMLAPEPDRDGRLGADGRAGDAGGTTTSGIPFKLSPPLDGYRFIQGHEPSAADPPADTPAWTKPTAADSEPPDGDRRPAAPAGPPLEPPTDGPPPLPFPGEQPGEEPTDEGDAEPPIAANTAPPSLDQVRLESLNQNDPVTRLAMLDAMVQAGDDTMAGFAVAALEEIPTFIEHQNGETRPNFAKLDHAETLVNTLANRGLYEQGEQVVDLVTPLHRQTALLCINRLLGSGYPGRDNRFAELNVAEFLAPDNLTPSQMHTRTLLHFAARAEYGEDFLNEETPAGRAFAEFLDAELGDKLPDKRYLELTTAYAQGGHLDLATTAKDRIEEPYWRGIACLQIAQASQVKDIEAPVGDLVAEAGRNVEGAAACNGSCDRAHCRPSLDAREIEIGMASVLAKDGQVQEARRLVGGFLSAFAYGQAAVHAQLYNASGETTDRQAALSALVESTAFAFAPSLSGAIVRTIGETDQRLGRTMSSLQADGEAVPLICWELRGLYDQPSYRERQIQREGISEGGLHSAEWMGLDPATLLSDVVASRHLIRDHCLAELVRLTAPAAPHTALALVGQIKLPAERARALTSMARSIAP